MLHAKTRSDDANNDTSLALKRYLPQYTVYMTLHYVPALYVQSEPKTSSVPEQKLDISFKSISFAPIFFSTSFPTTIKFLPEIWTASKVIRFLSKNVKFQLNQVFFSQ